MKVAIIGGKGFLGRHVIKECAGNSIDIRIFNRKNHDLFRPITLRSLLQSVDAVIHLAGRNKDAQFHEMVKTNVVGTERLLQAVMQYAPKAKFCFASTLLAYIKEDEYGQTKKIAEEIIEDYAKRERLQYVILRFSNLYGVGAKPYRNSVIATFIDKIKNGEALPVAGTGRQERDFLYVTDAARAMLLALQSKNVNSKTIDICTGQRTSLITVIGLMKRYAQRKVRTEKVSHRSVDHPYHLKKNFAVAKKMLQWYPQISMEEGVQQILKHHGV